MRTLFLSILAVGSLDEWRLISSSWPLANGSKLLSGYILVLLGALLFAGEFWRLRVYLNRVFEALGLT